MTSFKIIGRFIFLGILAIIFSSCNQKVEDNTSNQDSDSNPSVKNDSSVDTNKLSDRGKIVIKTDSNNINTEWLLNNSSNTIIFIVEHREEIGNMPVGNKMEIKVEPQASIVLGLYGDFGFKEVVNFEKSPDITSLPLAQQEEYASCLKYHAMSGQSENVKNSRFKILSASISQ